MQGRRIKKTVNGEVTLHVWDGSNIVSDADENRNAKSSYYRGIKLIAGRSGTSTAQYYVYDGHGNVTGYAGENYSYDAFGNLQTDNENINPFLYCGEYTDAETGMIYLRNRYYDPTTGRFITEDIAHDGLLYTYCKGNPVNSKKPPFGGFSMCNKFISELFWRNVLNKLKLLYKITAGRKTCLHCNICYAQIGCCKQKLCFFDSLIIKIFSRAFIDNFFKHSGKIAVAHMAKFSHVTCADVTCTMLIYVFKRRFKLFYKSVITYC